MEILLLLIVLVVLVVPFALMVLAVIDLARRPAWQWEAAQQNQIVWAVVVVLIGCVGPLIYLLLARPKLEAVGQGGPPVG